MKKNLSELFFTKKRFIAIIFILAGATGIGYFILQNQIGADIIGVVNNSASLTYTNSSGVQRTALSNSVSTNLTGATTPDTTPPTVSGGTPSGALAAGTTTATLSVITNESATCKYGTANVAYESLTSTFTTTGTTSHSSTLSGLTNGTSYNYNIRCKDTAGNVTAASYPVSFSVAAGPLPDTVAPTGSININKNAASTNAKTVTLYLTAADNTGGSGMGTMRFSNNGASWSGWYNYAVTKSSWNIISGYGATSGKGVKTVYVQFKDKAGNISIIYSDTFGYRQ